MIARAECYVRISAQAFFSVRDGFPDCPSCACKMFALGFPGSGPWEKNPREHAVKVWERLARGISGFWTRRCNAVEPDPAPLRSQERCSAAAVW